MRTNLIAARCVLSLAVLLQPLAAAQAANPLECVIDQVHNAKRYLGKKRPDAVEDPCVEEVAAEIDWLEHQIETFGTVVPKQPDVWGEARLTKHRQEVEHELAKRLDGFEETLQGAIRRSDQSFLSAALTLNAAAGGESGGGGASMTDSLEVLQAQTDLAQAQASIAANQAQVISAQTEQIESLLGDPNAATQSLIVRAPQTVTSGASPFKFKQSEISLEPVTFNRQLSVYLNALNELRRINEGDDTSDSPGYSLNLVRIPVSLLPGKMTRKGYGAEVTFTVEPQITDDLLPTTMRSLIVNDVVDLLSIPVSQQLFNDRGVAESFVREVNEHNPLVEEWLSVYDGWLALFPEAIQSAPNETEAQRLRSKLDFFHRIREYIATRLLQVATVGEGVDRFAVELPIDVSEVLRRMGVNAAPERMKKVSLVARLRYSEAAKWANRVARQFSKDDLGTATTAKRIRFELQLTIDRKAEDPIPIDVCGLALKPPVQYVGDRVTLTPPFDVPKLREDSVYADSVLEIPESAERRLEAQHKKLLEFLADLPTVSAALVDAGFNQAVLKDVQSYFWATKECALHTPEQRRSVLRQVLELEGGPEHAELLNVVSDEQIAQYVKLLVAEDVRPRGAAPDCEPPLPIEATPDSQSERAGEDALPPEFAALRDKGVPRIIIDAFRSADWSAQGQAIVNADDARRALREFSQEKYAAVPSAASTIDAVLDQLTDEEVKAAVDRLVSEDRESPRSSDTQSDERGVPAKGSSRNEGAGEGSPPDGPCFSRRCGGPHRGKDSVSESLPPLSEERGCPEESLCDDIICGGSTDLTCEIYKFAACELRKYLNELYPGTPSYNLDEYHRADAKKQPIPNLVDGVSTGALSPRLTHEERPIPPSIFMQVVGTTDFGRLVVSADRSVSRMLASKDVASYLDVRQFLIEETQRAYRWLSHEGLELWPHFATQQLSDAVRRRDFATINQMHRAFDRAASARSVRSVTAALAWSILVDAALLNQRLIDDMKRVSREKGCVCLSGENLSFVGPEEVIAPEAQEAFKEYVRCRWPIQVFALDPAAEDQNIADQFSRRRELQLALAAGVARGTVRAQVASRFARRLETDIETISLNRTQVAFSHGADTFGWRFYPRLQTPDTPGTLGAMYETLTGGPDADADLRDRGLEPGLRECTAVIVMPSFIPHVTFQSRGSWFGLTNPRKKALTLQDAMKISRNFQAVRRGLRCATESCVYRPGDVAHMSRVVDQIERRLPMQHMLTPVPFENTLGGFEMFSTGVTDLAPELYGWYGAPGVTVKTKDVACEKEGVDLSGNQCAGTCGGTTIFLVGNRFSVHDTKVIAGGKCVPFTLVSREIMRATIPYDAGTVEHTLSDGKTKQPYVDVHIATPYGVTSHLLVKAVKAAETKTEEELAKSVAALTETVEKIERDVVPVTAQASSKTPKIELAAMLKADGGMVIDPVLGAADIIVEFVNQTAAGLKGKLQMALLKSDVYVTSRLSLEESIDAPASNNPKNPKSVTLNAGVVAKKIEGAIGKTLKTSDFKNKKLSLIAVLFLEPDSEQRRTTRVLGEIPVEITLAEGQIRVVRAVGIGAGALSAQREWGIESEAKTAIRLLPSTR